MVRGGAGAVRRSAELPSGEVRGSERVLGPGERAVLDVLVVGRAARSSSPCRSAYCLTKLAIRPVRRPKASCQTSTWPSHSAPAPMPMVGMASSLVICAGDVAGHHLHHHGERAGVLDGVGVGEHPLGRVAAALDPVAAEGVLALRREADVGHHRDAALARRLIWGAISTPPSSFTQWARPSFMKRDAGGVGLLRRALVGAEGQVADDERALYRAAHGAGEREQLVDGDRDGRLVAVDVVGRGVADQEDVDAGLVEGRRRRTARRR